MERTLSLLRARALPHLSDNCLRASPRPAHHPPSTRTVTSSTTLNAPLPKPHQLPPRPKIKEEDITESFLKGSGPGGQKINKTASAVQLTHTPTSIVIKCQETRSRTQNRKIARRILAERVEEAAAREGGFESREGMKGRVAGERKKRGEKKRRRKYRSLEAAKSEEVGTGEEEEGEEVEEGGEDELDGEGSRDEVEDSSSADREGGSEPGGGDAEQNSHGERKRQRQRKARERYEPEGTQQDTVNKLFEEARERMGKTKSGKG